MSLLGGVIAAGMTTALGIFLMATGAARRTVALGSAFAALDGLPAEEPSPSLASEGGAEAWASALHRRLRVPLSPKQQQLLRLQGRSVGDYFLEKLVLTTAGFLLPIIWLVSRWLTGGAPSYLPFGLSLVGAAAGWFLADVSLANRSKAARRAAAESIHTFFDLVALERLANASGTQAVAAAAEISDAPLFRRITAGLERAHMEQVAPWAELRAIAQEWSLPELDDFADVMRLESQGAALSDVLQARVRELRDAHLASERAAAQAATEGLAIWMTLPALLLGAALVVPPLLTILAT